ncbi:astacin (Peptidase family m12A) domain-containing protein [Ditylenchus destructor]|uniref:Metalloendopeptidase n=1 Tax=Ditylenchus destructor TaxID=166010 RepID=A0AAD4R420_9BILA|nr:astacin (Peptidase family m12A) domain-containing protein [Ditylenchus destructor]
MVEQAKSYLQQYYYSAPHLVGFSRAYGQTFLTPSDFIRALREENVTFLTETDFVNAKKYRDLFSATKKFRPRNILSTQKYYRGDIHGKAALRRERHPKTGKPADSPLSTNNIRRNGVVSVVKKWQNGRIPYVLSTQYSERERAILARAFQEYHTRTCIRFTPRTAYDRDFLYIGKIDGCYSDVGRAGGKQELSLDDGCLHLDTIIHELMHSVGFYHEHERWDRDNFISILWPNIDREAYDQFGRVDLTESSYYGQQYDYNSSNFSKNGRETLVAKQPGMTAVIGSALDFSQTDLSKIQRMYQCPGFIDPIDSPNALEFSNTVTGSSMASAPSIRPYNALITQNLLPRRPSTGHISHPNRPFFPRALPSPKTSPETNSPPCVDKATLCWRWLDRCNSVFFEKIMKEFCASSCNFCSANDTELPFSPFFREEAESVSEVHSFPVLVNAPNRRI